MKNNFFSKIVPRPVHDSRFFTETFWPGWKTVASARSCVLSLPRACVYNICVGAFSCVFSAPEMQKTVKNAVFGKKDAKRFCYVAERL